MPIILLYSCLCCVFTYTIDWLWLYNSLVHQQQYRQGLVSHNSYLKNWWRATGLGQLGISSGATQAVQYRCDQSDDYIARKPSLIKQSKVKQKYPPNLVVVWPSSHLCSPCLGIYNLQSDILIVGYKEFICWTRTETVTLKDFYKWHISLNVTSG